MISLKWEYFVPNQKHDSPPVEKDKATHLSLSYERNVFRVSSTSEIRILKTLHLIRVSRCSKEKFKPGAKKPMIKNCKFIHAT